MSESNDDSVLPEGENVEIRDKNKSDIHSIFEEANNLFEQGKFLEAIANYEKAIEMGADFPEVFGNLGSALLEVEEYEKAIVFLKKCLALEPSEKIPYVINYSLALFKSGRVKEAIETLSKILGKTRDDHLEAIAHYHMGLFLIHDNPKKALKHFQTSLKFEENPLAYYEASCALARLGKKGPAATMLKKAVKIDVSLIEVALDDPDLKEVVIMPVITQFFNQFNY